MGLALVENEFAAEQITFDDFWLAYPRRQKRKEAQIAWKRIDSGKYAEILRGVAAWKKSDQWLRDNGQYIPMPTSFLNGERWADEVEISVKSSPCAWPRCKAIGSMKHGVKDFCEAHIQALKRGETP